MTLKLDTSIQYLKGVGPKMAEKFARLGIETIRDLVFYFPRAWQDFSRPQKISSLRIDQDVIICAEVTSIRQSRTRRKWMSIIEANLADETGEIKAIWFNQPFLMKVLKPGEKFLFAGKVGWNFQNKTKNFQVGQVENLSAGEPLILPIYSETEGLNSRYIRRILQPIIKDVMAQFDDFLPEPIIIGEKLIGFNEALLNIHFPQNSDLLAKAKERLAFDELFLIGLRMLNIKKELSKNKAIALFWEDGLLKEFVKKLPYQLTNAQRRAAWEILCDLKKSQPMNRLLEGDVGSGKTVVATMAALVAAKNNLQTVWLAPTEILANQHFKNVKKLLAPFNIKIGLLTSANKKADLKKDRIIIGTHALIQKDVRLPNLGLIIIDEQHRFGVKQRSHLRQQSVVGRRLTIVPHLLSMTATPIPRTLALALYGDLDISVINEMPPGRKKVLTKVVSPQHRAKAYDFIAGQIKAGRQVFVICPLIEPKDTPPAGGKINLFEADRKSAVAEYEKLKKQIFPQFKIGLLHGKMKAKEKDAVMKKFGTGKLDILVSTAVVEVGIDVSNASVMMIESAERFGLAQLHQFRGRVGRSTHQSFCFLFSESFGAANKNRLRAMVNCFDGFQLAQKDLAMRGPGELSGLRQAGLPDLKMATLADTIMMTRARRAAEKIIGGGLKKYPKLSAELTEFETARHLE